MIFQYLILFFFTLTCLISCNTYHNNIVLEGKTMGTVWRVILAGIDIQQKFKLFNDIQAQLNFDEQELSTWKNNSILSRFNRFQGCQPQKISNNIANIIAKELYIGNKTNGALDITIGSLVNLWGFGPINQPKHIPSNDKIAAIKALTGLQHLRVIYSFNEQWLQKDIPGLYVDLSSVGEGYATDHLALLLEQKGINNYLVSVGGAVLSHGMNSKNRPWRVGIQKPTDLKNLVELSVDLHGHGISTSGSYRNYYELDGKRISHIIDPTTGRPINHNLVSVTVISNTALESDSWDTSLMVMGNKRAQLLALKEKLAVLLISKHGNGFVSWMSPQFKSFVIS
ncbi:FAD:protein FMN transferase ApbE [Pantoea sp. Aalb]|uniref:FAD:protein FMN transferase ApbE n=1 Tax=Pantoea sp. Aalb TaxID=2576762 RepID=UPI001329009F|nr:FAD:protein FMN transferase ApbE [Pantoea sp. Aalb]MXP67319.1 FAD:protein FMN transferase ApbE [Pantoea sp. Aalb]